LALAPLHFRELIQKLYLKNIAESLQSLFKVIEYYPMIFNKDKPRGAFLLRLCARKTLSLLMNPRWFLNCRTRLLLLCIALLSVLLGGKVLYYLLSFSSPFIFVLTLLSLLCFFRIFGLTKSHILWDTKKEFSFFFGVGLEFELRA
jgi:hypothetical protein